MGYRHELKYLMSLGEAEYLCTRLRLTLPKDPHAEKNGGSYYIRSLYFDSWDERAVSEKISGVEFRDKYRIRIYNYSDKTIKLERKHKSGQFIKKEGIPLSRKECERLIKGDFSFLLTRKEAFAKELYAAWRLQQLKPKVLVDYEREPFMYPVEDVRITFDRNVRTAMRCTELFDPHVPTYPTDDYGDCCIMEVKFARFLPGYIRSLIQVDAGEHVAASKYLACRQYDF